MSRLRLWCRWRPEWPLGAVALAGWVLILLSASGPAAGGHAHPRAGFSLSGWLQSQGHWLLMVVAMMIPPALPMARIVARNSKRYRRHRAILLFAVSSLLIWLPFGLVAITATELAGAPGWLLGASLLVAALWELTPVKRRAVKACHRAVPLPPDGRRADRACVKQGLYYGKACFKSCWALMLPMAVAGYMSLSLMVVLGVVATAEELVVKGYRLAPPAAVLLAVAGGMVLVLG